MIEMRNERTGARRSVPHLGFSWTTLFLGPLLPLFRGDWKWALIMYFVIQIVVPAAAIVSVGIAEALAMPDPLASSRSLFFGGAIGLVLTQPVFATIYNRRYYADLVNDGYEEWSSP